MSAINREDAIEAILSRLAKREEPTPPWIYATIKKCLNDLPSLPSAEPLVHDGFYLCDKKPGACPSWERKGWTKCESKHCNRTSRVDHALKLPDADDGWIPCGKRLPEEDDYNSCIECPDGAVWYITENGTMGIGYYYESTKEWSTTDDLKTDGKVVAWRSLPPAFRPKEYN